MGMGFSSARLFLALVSQGEVLAFCRRPFSRDFSSGSPSHGLQLCPKCSSKGFPRVHSPSGHSLLCWGLQCGGGCLLPRAPHRLPGNRWSPLCPSFLPAGLFLSLRLLLAAQFHLCHPLDLLFPALGASAPISPALYPISAPGHPVSPGNSWGSLLATVTPKMSQQCLRVHCHNGFRHIPAVGSITLWQLAQCLTSHTP